jgi:hypothetical protein
VVKNRENANAESMIGTLVSMVANERDWERICARNGRCHEGKDERERQRCEVNERMFRDRALKKEEELSREQVKARETRDAKSALLRLIPDLEQQQQNLNNEIAQARVARKTQMTVRWDEMIELMVAARSTWDDLDKALAANRADW